MRIDLNTIIPEAPDPGQSAKSASQAASGTASADGRAGGDTATLSQSQGRVQQLAAQAIQLPEIRQDKVAALQRAIQAGSYQVTPGQTAGALIAAMQNHPAA
jgi:flagellar biosynthesis anti-sigma factor FlgM